MVEGDREILTLREASEFLNCHPSTIYRLVKSSQIPAFRLGGSWRFVKPELNRWIKGLTEWPAHEEKLSADLNEVLSVKADMSAPASRSRKTSPTAIDGKKKARTGASARRRA